MAGSPGIRLAPDLPQGPRAALVIATTRYQDPDLRQLRAPAHDAHALADILADPGIGAFTVTPVVDADERHARRAIDVFLSGRGVGDVVVVYLSCHGVLDRRNRLYFAAADTVKTQLGSTGIPAAWLLEQLEECRASQQVVILDCCFSGAFAKGSKGDGDLDLERRLAGDARGRAVLTASRSWEYSFTGDALPGAAISGSVFTAGLVEGLRTGAADADGDGYITVDEAYDFAYRYVLTLGAAQTPQRWLSGGEGAIVLARSPAGIAITSAVLPGELADALESRYPAIRIGAVHELGIWLAGDDPGRTLAAERKLRQISDNDIHTVAIAARAYLNGPSQAAARTSPHSDSAAKDDNTAAEPAGKVPEPVRRTPDRAAWLLADAERAARSITNESDERGVRSAENVLSVVDPAGSGRARKDRAQGARLLSDAEGIARSITDNSPKESAPSAVAEALVATDPDCAQRIANSTTDMSASHSTSTAVRGRSGMAAGPMYRPSKYPGRVIPTGRLWLGFLVIAAVSAVIAVIASSGPSHSGQPSSPAPTNGRSVTPQGRNNGHLSLSSSEYLQSGVPFLVGSGRVLGVGSGMLSLFNSNGRLAWSKDTRADGFEIDPTASLAPQVSDHCAIFSDGGGSKFISLQSGALHEMSGHGVLQGDRAGWDDGTIRDGCTGVVLSRAAPTNGLDDPECLTGSIIIGRGSELAAWRAGHKLWQANNDFYAACDSYGSAVLYGGLFDYGGYKIELVDASTGRIYWRVNDPSCAVPAGTPCLSNPVAPVHLLETSHVIFLSTIDIVLAFERSTGRLLWRKSSGCLLAAKSSAQDEALIGPCVYVGDASGRGNVSILNAATGVIIKTLNPGGYNQFAANNHEILGVDSYNGAASTFDW